MTVTYANLPAKATIETANGLSTITIPAASLVTGGTATKELDESCAAISGRTGDSVLNYDRVVIGAGECAAEVTQTIGDGSRVGQTWELVTGLLTTAEIVVTVTKVVAQQTAAAEMAAVNTFTMGDTAGEKLRIRWDGLAWEVLSGNVGTVV